MKNFIQSFDFIKPLPVGHEALQGYQDGAYRIVNQLERILETCTTLDTFKAEVLKLVKDNIEFNKELEERWEQGDWLEFKGVTFDGIDPL